MTSGATSVKTTATGGSARSQADQSADDRKWTASPAKARMVKAVMFGLPVIAGYAASLVFSVIVPRPSGLLFAGCWWLAVIIISTAAIRVSRPAIRGLAPLAFLYQCSLVFPGDAPSRYKVALKQRSARELQRRVDTGESLDDTPAEAAEDILALLAALNDHDRRTRGHSERVRAYSDLLAEEMGLSVEDRAKLHWAALLHDVGKMAVDPDILNKDGRPTDEEWQQLRDHPRQSARLLRPLRPWLGTWLDAATQHHERWDGDGYPRKLAGNQISLSGRIVAVADAYDVMTSSRSYKAAWPADKARAELARCAGTQFDPTVVRAFLKINSRDLDKVAGPIAWFASAPQLVEGASVAATAGTTASGLMATAALTATLIVAPATFFTADSLPTAGATEAEAAATTVEATLVDEPTTTTVVIDEEYDELADAPVAPTTTVDSSDITLPVIGLQATTTTSLAAPTTSSVSTTTSVASTTTSAPTTTAAPTTSAAPTTTTAAPTTTVAPTTTTFVPPTTEPPGPQGPIEAVMQQMSIEQLSFAVANGTAWSGTEAFWARTEPIVLDGPLTVSAIADGQTVTNDTAVATTIPSGTTICGVVVFADMRQTGSFLITPFTDMGVLGLVLTESDWAGAEPVLTGESGYFGALEGPDQMSLTDSPDQRSFDVQVWFDSETDTDSFAIITDCIAQ